MSLAPTGGFVRRFGGAASVLMSITAARAGEQFRWILAAPQTFGNDLARHTPVVVATTSKRAVRDLGRLSTVIGQNLSSAAQHSTHGSRS